MHRPSPDSAARLRALAKEAEAIDIAALALRARGARAAEIADRIGLDEVTALRSARRAQALLRPSTAQ